MKKLLFALALCLGFAGYASAQTSPAPQKEKVKKEAKQAVKQQKETAKKADNPKKKHAARHHAKVAKKP